VGLLDAERPATARADREPQIEQHAGALDPRITQDLLDIQLPGLMRGQGGRLSPSLLAHSTPNRPGSGLKPFDRRH
jgi:hypothetical protein